MTIGHDRVVTIRYEVTNTSGEVVDSSDGQEPLVYLHGHGEIVPGLERALDGRDAGEKVAVTLAPADAYGEYDPELDVGIPKDAFPEEARERLVPGSAFVAEHPEHPGEEMLLRVLRTDDDTIWVSGNHPLAGEALSFAVDVVEVREATIAEVEHGHAHGPHGHDHDHGDEEDDES
ncbi:MAG: peptidylprolyl isomerase [Deltaproteobacteria bacterium]|nr:peptidylprolyl isomerase [Deltaproteobacteria bacterium]